MKDTIALSELISGRYTLDNIQRMFELGTISADLYEQYCYQWRNSCYRFSSLCEGYQEPGYSIRKELAGD